MGAILGILILVGGLAVIAALLERVTGGQGALRREVKTLRNENEVFRSAIADVRKASRAAIATGDPLAHDFILNRTRNVLPPGEPGHELDL